MSDVAQLAGVSHQTVSRVIHDNPHVRPETRERVLAAIRELGYRPNVSARALVTRRTSTIGVLASGSALFGPSSTLFAIEEAARESGLFVSLATVGRWRPEAVETALDHFMGQGVDGVVVVAAHNDAITAVRDFTTRVPIVMVGPHELGSPGLFAVAVDQYAGARAATAHLLDLGHRHVIHVAGPQDWLDARLRLQGWRDAMAAAGLPAPEPVLATWSADDGYRVGRRLVDEGLPTAVFTANDQLALGLMRAFAEAGVRVPGDVSVVGFDDVDGSAHFFPPLTTVRQEFAALGRRCVQILLGAIAGDRPDAELIEPRLVVRSSTAGPRAN